MEEVISVDGWPIFGVRLWWASPSLCNFQTIRCSDQKWDPDFWLTFCLLWCSNMCFNLRHSVLYIHVLYMYSIWHFFIIWCADYSVCSINGHYSTLYTFCVALRFLYTLAVQWMLKSEQRILAITSYVVTSKTSSSFIDSELCIRPPDSVIVRELEANFGYLSWDEAAFQEKVLKSHVIVVH